MIWEYKGPPCNQYQVEHDLLFEAIRQDKPYNETERCAKAAMTGILGRMAAESGKVITWDEALASNLELAPGLDNYTMDSNPPVMPDGKGRYPVAMPGDDEGAVVIMCYELYLSTSSTEELIPNTTRTGSSLGTPNAS